MAEQFNAYYEWLGIPPDVAKPHHYQLLGIRPFEDNPRVIENAADRQMSHLRTFQSGAHSADSQRILNEVSAAKLCLLKPEKKTAYDAQLKTLLEPPPAAQPKPAQTPTPNLAVPHVAAVVQPASQQPAPFQRVVTTPVRAAPVAEPKPAAAFESFVPDVAAGDVRGQRGVAGRNRAHVAKKPGVKSPAVILLAVAGGTAIAIVAGFLLLRGNNARVQVAEADPAALKAKQAASAKDSAKKPPRRAEPAVVEDNRNATDTATEIAVAEKTKPEPVTNREVEESKSKAMEAAKPTSAEVPSTTAPAIGEAPAPPTQGEPVDLLKLIDPKRNAVKGEWSVRDGMLITPGSNYVTLQIPFSPPSDYTLTIVGTRESGDDLGIYLVVGGKQVCVTLDGWFRKTSGIGKIDGKAGNNNSSTNHIQNVLGDHQRYTVVCTVRGNSLEASVNGNVITKWSGAPDQLSLNWGGGPHKDWLQLGHYQAVHHISAITLVPLSTQPAGSGPAGQTQPSVAMSKPAERTAPLAETFLFDLDVLESRLRGGVKDKVVVNGVPSPHGIFLHPADDNNRAFAAFLIDGKFDDLEGRVSLNDSTQKSDEMFTFSVRGDGKLLWQSEPLNSREGEQPFRVNVQGVERLELLCTAPTSNRFAHAVWIEPRLSRRTGLVASLTPSNPAVGSAPPPAPANSEPAKADADGWVDLLDWASRVDWASRGIDWNEHCAQPPTKDSITLKSRRFDRFPLPAIIDGSYEMEIEFTRQQGNEGVWVCFPVGIHNTVCELSGAAGQVGGVNWIDGKNYTQGNATTHRPCPLTNGERHRLLFRVQQDGDKAAFKIDLDDAKGYITWQGSYDSLANREGSGWKLSMIRRPWIGAYESLTTFHKVRVRMTSGEIRPDFITDADRQQDLAQGFVRLIGQQANSPSVGWGKFVVNQIPLEHNPGDDEVRWPLITSDFSLCKEFYGAHAPSRLKCPIPKGAKSFATYGYNDSSRTVKYKVLVDGQEVVATGVAAIAPLRIDLPKGSKLLELVVNPAGSFDCDRSYWCYPRFHPLPIEKLTAKMIHGKPGPLKFTVASSTVGLGELTSNSPIKNSHCLPLDLDDAKPCDEFLYAHAASSVSYSVPMDMKRFTAIGYCVWSQHVKYQVWADTDMIYESPIAGIVPIDIKLPAGTKTIDLRIDNLGNLDRDDSMWCYPRLHRN